MLHLHAIPDEQIRREIEALRLQAEACPPSAGLLQSQRHHSLLTKAWRLESELERRKFVATRGKKRHAKRLRYSWTLDRDFAKSARTVSARMNRAAKQRLALLLELPEPPKGGLAARLGIE